MATVRFSEALRNTIRNNARKLFEAEGERVNASFNKEVFNGLYDKLFGEYSAHFNALPKEFFKTARSFDVHVFRSAQAIRYTLPEERPVPATSMKVEGKFAINPHYSVPDIYLDSNNPKWKPLQDEYIQWKERKQVFTTKLNDYLDMVSKVVNSHVTLAPALKVWPALWELLPEDTKEKHKEVKESRKKKVQEQLEGVDFTKLTAAVTVNKLRGR